MFYSAPKNAETEVHFSRLLKKINEFNTECKVNDTKHCDVATEDVHFSYLHNEEMYMQLSGKSVFRK